MSAATTTAAALPSTPELLRSRGGKPMPELTDIVAVLAILAGYGRHLAETIEHRFLTRGFATIAQYFGTAVVPVMMAHVRRGLMRLAALEKLLRQRAARGRDLMPLSPRRSQASLASAAISPDAASAAQLTAQPMPQRRRARSEPPPLTLATLPSMAQIEAEVRRRSVGQNLVAICHDLGIAPTLCASWFWNDIHMALYRYRGSVHRILVEMRHRQYLLDHELGKYAHLTLPEDTREGVRKVVGFFIGEPPFDPYQPTPDSAENRAGHVCGSIAADASRASVSETARLDPVPGISAPERQGSMPPPVGGGPPSADQVAMRGERMPSSPAATAEATGPPP